MIKNLKEKWSNFCGIIFGPGSIIFIILTIGSLILAYFYKTNTLFSTFLTVISSVFAGFSGTFIKDDYDRLISKNILEKKGRSALRNLETINTQLINIRNWILNFGKSLNKEGKGALEEVDRHISTVQLNINSGLLDWIDIVPELKENIQQEVLLEKKYKEVVQSFVTELLEKKKELIASKDEKQNSELKKKISDLEKQIKDIQKERSHVSMSGSLTSTSGLSRFLPGNVVVGYSPFSNKQICAKCGGIIDDQSLVDSWGHSTTQYCNACKKDLGLL